MAELLTPSTDLHAIETHVIFVHGLNGDKELTWRSPSKDGTFWPRWLESDLQGVAVWSVGYSSPATRWRGSAMHLPDAAENVLERLVREPRLGNGTIAFIGHSRGGLLIKEMLRRAERDANADAARASLLHRSRKVAFLATPHTGAALADWAYWLKSFVWPSNATAGLRPNDPHLRDLNQWYRAYANTHEIQTLVLWETQNLKIFGRIVKADSSDPGIAGAKLIPVEADHSSICKPADRDSEIYIHIKDFVASPISGQHKDVKMLSAVTDLGASIGGLEDFMRRSLPQQVKVVDAPSRELADAEAIKRLDWLTRARLLHGFDGRGEARRLAAEFGGGKLAAASPEVRARSLAWCARILTPEPTTEEAETLLASLAEGPEVIEVRVAKAFLAAARGDPPAGLAALASEDRPIARSASLFIAKAEKPAVKALQWFDTAIGSIAALDGDGKLLLIELYCDAGKWDEAVMAASGLEESDFSQTPALFVLAGMSFLMSAVPLELRSQIWRRTVFDRKNFPLAADSPALASRRRARDLFERGVRAIRELGSAAAANHCADDALWLDLRDPERSDEGRRRLAESMGDPVSRLRRLPLALQFGLKLDMPAVEREIERESALTGGRSIEVALARLAVALSQKSEYEVARYVAAHRQQLLVAFDEHALSDLEIRMLVKSGRVGEAENLVAQLAERPEFASDIAKLRTLIDSATSLDPIDELQRRYERSEKLVDLQELVQALECQRDWPQLAELSKRLFELTHDLPHAEILVRALAEVQDDEGLVAFVDEHTDLAVNSDLMIASAAWSLYRLGRLTEATKRLALLQAKRDDENDRGLALNIAVASGNWEAILTYVETEWTSRASRKPKDILRVAHIAKQIGSPRLPELLRHAVAMAPDDPMVLVGSYSLASGAGLDTDEETSLWLQKAAALSERDGPVQQVSIRELLERQPEWDRRQNEISQHYIAGRLPLVGVALGTNRSIADLHLKSALSNGAERDVRRRSLVLAYSGARPTADGKQLANGSFRTAAFDPCALLTLALLGLLERALAAFDRIAIPHSTMGWIMEEMEKNRFHQPSRLKEARELQLLRGDGSIRTFEPTAIADATLSAEIGEDLAEMLTQAQSAQDDGRQHVVVRPGPVFRMGSLMEEPADLSQHEHVLRSCLDVVAALKRSGQLTIAEEERATAYLKFVEEPWSRSKHIEANAVIYLDEVGLSYLYHLGLIQKIARSGLDVVVPSRRIEENQALLRYEQEADRIEAILHETRHCLAKGIAAGTVQLGQIGSFDEGPQRLRDHPSLMVARLAAESDALVIDDRTINQHLNLDAEPGLRPILTTLDVLALLTARGMLSVQELQEARTTLRSGGLALIPIQAEELIDLLATCSVDGGVLQERAELRAIRESVLRLGMTDALQLPAEAPWLHGLLQARHRALEAQWVENCDEEKAAARSNWLIGLVDIRSWSHRLFVGEAASPWKEGYRSELMTLMTLPHDKPRKVKAAYFQWLQRDVLEPLEYEDPESFANLLQQVRDLIEELVRSTERQVDAT